MLINDGFFILTLSQILCKPLYTRQKNQKTNKRTQLPPSHRLPIPPKENRNKKKLHLRLTTEFIISKSSFLL